MKAVWLDIVWYAFYWFPSKRVCFRLLAIRLRALNAKRKMSHAISSSLLKFFVLTCVCMHLLAIFYIPSPLFQCACVQRMCFSFGFVADFLSIYSYLNFYIFFDWCVHLNVLTLVKLCAVVSITIHLICLPLLNNRTIACPFSIFHSKEIHQMILQNSVQTK